jgi:hypothetical protein
MGPRPQAQQPTSARGRRGGEVQKRSEGVMKLAGQHSSALKLGERRSITEADYRESWYGLLGPCFKHLARQIDPCSKRSMP